MTTLIVSLFLPYTIDFEVESTSPDRKKESLVQIDGRRRSIARNSSQHSLLEALAASTFQEEDQTNPFSTTLSTVSETLLPHKRPHGLARTDSRAPEWGQSFAFNQPTARLAEVPSSAILQYAKTVEQKEAHQNGSTPRHHFRSVSSQGSKRFKGANWTVERAVQGNGGLTNAVQAASDAGIIKHKQYIGTLGFPTDDLDERTKEQISDKLENDFDSNTVFVSDNDFDGHYRHYCKTILWPVFHYQIPDHPKSKAYLDHSWKYYVKVNEIFADRVISSYKHGDTIWVHDYHLLLVPNLIRKRVPDAKIGLFLHTPFPSSEIFRCLPVRDELLGGMLGANVVIFQALEYSHHFLQTCSHLLALEATDEGVTLEDRFVDVASVPLGIIPEKISSARAEHSVLEWTAILTEKYKGKKLIVASDKLENTRGVRQKLLAYELFLDQNIEHAKNTVMIQVAISTQGENYNLDSAISDILTRIDARHATLAHQPVVFLKQDIAFSQHLALLSVADALMVTSLRDGMNLTCHEFVVCQDGSLSTSKRHGVPILSEFIGAASVFSDPTGGPSPYVPVNPWDCPGSARAIKKALELSKADREHRFRRLHQAVLGKDGMSWIEQLQTLVDDAHSSRHSRDIMSVPRLSVDVLSEQYRAASTRLFILDWEGTLSSWGAAPKTALANPQRAVDILCDLMSASDNNIVYVASNHSINELEHWFHQVPDIGLIAENGCYVRPFTTDSTSEEWIDLVDTKKSLEWKTTVANILQYYVDRIDGAEIEERHSSLLLKYNNVKDEDAEAAAKLAADCANHLNDSCKSLGVRAIPIDKAVILELTDYNKKTASARVLKHEQLRLTDRLEDETESFWMRSNSGPSSPRGRSSGMSSTAASRAVSHTDRGSGSPSSFATISPLAKTPEQRPFQNTSRPGIADPPHVISDGRLTSPRPASRASDDNALSSPVDLACSSGPHFLMVAGDDREDEAVFRWANALEDNGTIRSVITVCVGKRNTTEAKATLTQGVTGLLNVLGKLGRI